jgi:molybdopterin-guanine dinucleotide biosynthesis protein A
VTSIPQAITGVILAGGQSSRMGQNKALMSLGGKRLVDRVVEVMRAVFRDLLMVTNTPEVYADLGLPMVRDVWPEKGSLGGVYSAIYHVTTPYCLVVACDMPFLNAAVLRYLITQMADYDVIIPDVLDELQTLHAIYSKACLQPIERRLEANRLRIVGFFPDVRVRTVTASELQVYDPELLAFQNLNTPEEFQAAEQRLMREPPAKLGAAHG